MFLDNLDRVEQLPDSPSSAVDVVAGVDDDTLVLVVPGAVPSGCGGRGSGGGACSAAQQSDMKVNPCHIGMRLGHEMKCFLTLVLLIHFSQLNNAKAPTTKQHGTLYSTNVI